MLKRKINNIKQISWGILTAVCFTVVFIMLAVYQKYTSKPIYRASIVLRTGYSKFQEPIFLKSIIDKIEWPIDSKEERSLVFFENFKIRHWGMQSGEYKLTFDWNNKHEAMMVLSSFVNQLKLIIKQNANEAFLKEKKATQEYISKHKKGFQEKKIKSKVFWQRFWLEQWRQSLSNENLYPVILHEFSGTELINNRKNNYLNLFFMIGVGIFIAFIFLYLIKNVRVILK